jgi:hypothetical protein
VGLPHVIKSLPQLDLSLICGVTDLIEKRFASKAEF